MASKILLLRGVLTVLFVTTTCLGFNIDERFPVIKEGKTAGRLFGFSVALHYQTQGTKQYLLLVGAPKEKAVLQLNDVEETGAIYSCPITTDTSDCSRMDLVSSTDDSEMVEGMWLGVTVASQQEIHGGRVLACGHRYIKVVGGAPEEHRRMVGKCYVRGNDLTYDPRDGWQTYNYEVCNSNYNEKSEGLCSMGLAAGFTETDVYIGTVGSYTWQGNVHITWRDPDLDIPLNTDFGELTNRNIYMGYSVHEDKNMLSRSEDTVVTGSPRDESRGSVTLARKDSKLVPVLVIPGEQVGSYFGNSLAVTDLNNDDWNDLIVGAPFYFDRKEEKGGAVYVYMNENGSFQNSPTLVLKGPKDSGFGFAVAAIGDINQDGFQDIAVGAPFYESGEVYIWMGSGKGLSGDASQVIKGQTVNSGFKTFGYSINGGIDMDENRYPDIVVGSLDDRVALLRARPVIHISKNFTVQPKIVDPKLCPPNDKPCITVTVCFSYTLSTGNKDLKKDVTVNYTVKADVNRRSTRVRFLANQEDSYSDLVILPSPEAVCSVLQLIVKENVRDKLEAVVFSLSMALHENKPKSRRSLQNLDSYPILSPKEKVTERTEINFQKECGTDNKCSSNLQLTAKFANEDKNPYPSKGNRQVLQYSSDVKKVLLLVEVTNFPSHGKVAEDAHQAMLNITIPSTLRYAGVRSEEPDVECSAEETVLCELGNPLKSNEKVLLRIKFETSGVTLYTQEIESWLKLSTLSEQNDLLPVPVVMLIENTILTSFSIEQPQVLTQFSGEVMGESAMNTTSDVGSPVEYTYKVKVLGQPLGNMGSLALEFEWPFEVTNGKWLLYLTEIVTKGTAESRCVPPGDVVNVLNLTLSNTRSKRPKREVEEETIQPLIIEPQATITGLTPRKESFLLDCSLNTARCVTFTCPLTNMSQSAEVIVRSRVWNSTMLEDYANSLRVTVKGKVTLKLITDKPTIKMNDETREFGVNIDPVLGEETPYEVPLWIIIVAAVAGILVLGVISLILWKLGFFRRAIYYRIMPKYHGVKIRREERYQLEYQFNMGFMPEDPQKKYWITNWTEMQQYYY